MNQTNAAEEKMLESLEYQRTTQLRMMAKNKKQLLKLARKLDIALQEKDIAYNVGLYVKTSLNANCRDDMTNSTDDFETIWVEISNNKDKLMVGVVYRHPNSNFLAFQDELFSSLHKIFTFLSGLRVTRAEKVWFNFQPTPKICRDNQY